MNNNPIFVHSLFRAGSTYVFMVFRRSENGYWCYQEPLHEIAFFSRKTPAFLLQDHGEEKVSRLRHPHIEKPYFQELHDTWPAWKDLLSESAIYDGYFAPANADIGIPYWRALMDAAKGRPVFQECRTPSRIGAIKEQLGGNHICLWRNPWDQWWSYKVNEYFDAANQLIINAPGAPPPVQALRSALGIAPCPPEGIGQAFAHYASKPLSAEDSYLIFYMLWCLGMEQGLKHADLMLNIDRLSDSSNYRVTIQSQLKNLGIAGIDFSDCKVPQSRYLDQDAIFFVALEDKVHAWLQIGGWPQSGIDQLLHLRRQFQPAKWQTNIQALNVTDLLEESSRTRELARRFETRAAVLSAKCRLDVAESTHLAEALLNSQSWRFTAPLRWIGSLVNRFAPTSLKQRAK